MPSYERANEDPSLLGRIGGFLARSWENFTNIMKEWLNTFLVSTLCCWAGYFWILIFMSIAAQAGWLIALEVTFLWVLLNTLWFFACGMAGLFLYYGIVAIVDWATQEKEICTQPTIN